MVSGSGSTLLASCSDRRLSTTNHGVAGVAEAGADRLPPPRTLQQAYAQGPMVVPGGVNLLVSEVPMYTLNIATSTLNSDPGVAEAGADRFLLFRLLP